MFAKGRAAIMCPLQVQGTQHASDFSPTKKRTNLPQRTQVVHASSRPIRKTRGTVDSRKQSSQRMLHWPSPSHLALTGSLPTGGGAVREGVLLVRAGMVCKSCSDRNSFLRQQASAGTPSGNSLAAKLLMRITGRIPPRLQCRYQADLGWLASRVWTRKVRGLKAGHKSHRADLSRITPDLLLHREGILIGSNRASFGVVVTNRGVPPGEV
jgi:hypothetical protein